MIKLLKVLAAFAIIVFTQLANAQQYTKVIYVHSDPDGTPFAATDERGNVEWQIDHFPYGKEYENTQVARKRDISFAGKPYDEEIGLSYFGGRWYDPDIGRFTSIDPMPVNPEDYRTYNRYAYGFNNPYKYVDPDGNLAFLIPVAIFIAKEVAAEAASRATGGATDFLSVRRLSQKVIKKGAQVIGTRGQKKLTTSNAGQGSTETVQRWMSDAELRATIDTGLVRGGRDGTHFVTDSANSNAKRARQRSALPQTPEVKVTLEVPAGKFSKPTKVEPAFNMPGGGTERTATGKISAKVKRIKR